MSGQQKNTQPEETYPGNSFEERRKKSKEAEAAVDKRNQAGSLESIFGEFVMRIINDSVVPALGGILNDILDNINYRIKQSISGSFHTGNRYSRGNMPYNSLYDNNRGRRVMRNDNDFDDPLIFDTRDEAENVRFRMLERCKRHGYASVADLYDFAKIHTSNYQLNEYGWTDFSKSTITHRGRDYILQMPRAIPLDGRRM